MWFNGPKFGKRSKTTCRAGTCDPAGITGLQTPANRAEGACGRPHCRADLPGRCPFYLAVFSRLELLPSPLDFWLGECRQKDINTQWAIMQYRIARVALSPSGNLRGRFSAPRSRFRTLTWIVLSAGTDHCRRERPRTENKQGLGKTLLPHTAPFGALHPESRDRLLSCEVGTSSGRYRHGLQCARLRIDNACGRITIIAFLILGPCRSLDRQSQLPTLRPRRAQPSALPSPRFHSSPQAPPGPREAGLYKTARPGWSER